MPPFARAIWSGLLGAACSATAAPATTEDTTRYGGELALAQASLAGRNEVVEQVVSSGNTAKDERMYRPLRLSPGDQPLMLTVASVHSDTQPAVRIQTRLEGRETEWHDNDGTMYLMLRYIDENNRAIGRATFARQGVSLGWNGVPQASRFQVSTEEAIAPPRTRKVQFLLASGGPTRTTGFWAVRRLRLLSAANEPGAEFVARYTLDALQGQDLDSPQGTPTRWVRDGTSLEMPQIFHLDGAGPMLAIVDADPNNTGGWMAALRDAIPVEPGTRLRVECEELYSIGRGYDAVVSFRNLPVGRYVFRARATDEFGRPTGPALRLPVEMRPPFYQTGWFRLSAVGLGLTTVFAVLRYVTWRRMQVKLQRLERQRAVEAERTRLARDLHDEMGARLTQISLLATRVLPSVPVTNSTHEPIRQIHDAVRELATALNEIVWAANPTLDTLEGFGNYLTRYAGEILRDAGLRCRLEIPALLPVRSFSSGSRHRLMMAVKEALTNVLRHARATEVRLSLMLSGDILELSIVDNGCGFNPAAVPRRNGLDNLRHRLAETGGTCEIESQAGQGTCVRLRMPLPREEDQR